jgi:hypothetical protein
MDFKKSFENRQLYGETQKKQPDVASDRFF